jgi:tetratricopeptide (TPR) repeat protein
MARSSLTLGPDNCPSCGAKIRKGRLRCLRCGASMLVVTRPPAAEPSVEGQHRALLIAGFVAGTMVVGAVGLMFTRPSDVRAAAATPATVIATASSARPAPDGAGSPGTTTAADPEDQSRDAVLAYRGGDIQGAIAQLTALVEAHPNDASALNNLGQVLVRARRASDAIPYFDRAIAQSPGTWAFHFNRAHAEEELQAWGAAVDEYRRAAVLFPGDYATQFNLAHALQASGDVQAAIDAYQKAVTLAPGKPDFLLSLAAAQETARQAADAANTYRKYLELEPASPDADKIKDRIARLTS